MALNYFVLATQASYLDSRHLCNNGTSPFERILGLGVRDPRAAKQNRFFFFAYVSLKSVSETEKRAGKTLKNPFLVVNF